MTRLLVARGTVLPFDAAFSVLEDHDVLVEGNRITAIAPAGTLEMLLGGVARYIAQAKG